MESLKGNEKRETMPFGTEYFTGIRASESQLTVANYIGGILPILDVQNSSEKGSSRPLLFVADMHAFTDQDASDIEKNRAEILETYIALGIDTDKTDIFVQSQIMDEVLQLTMLLSKYMTIQQIERVPTLKDKVKDPKKANMFLAQYPLMMAADIILQRAKLVPTGKDQKAHIEITRDLVDKLNARLTKKLLPKSDSMDEEPVNVLALRGDGKMSKSNPGAAILLDDTQEEIAEKVKRAQTSAPGEDSPQLASLIMIGTKLSNNPESKKLLETLYAEHLAGQQVATKIKEVVTDAAQKFILEYQAKKKIVQRNKQVIRDALVHGGERARNNAIETLELLNDGSVNLTAFRP